MESDQTTEKRSGQTEGIDPIMQSIQAKLKRIADLSAARLKVWREWMSDHDTPSQVCQKHGCILDLDEGGSVTQSNFREKRFAVVFAPCPKCEAERTKKKRNLE
jgi:hypothetical protein